jgi:hypothetical protein
VALILKIENAASLILTGFFAIALASASLASAIHAALVVCVRVKGTARDSERVSSRVRVCVRVCEGFVLA